LSGVQQCTSSGVQQCTSFFIADNMVGSSALRTTMVQVELPSYDPVVLIERDRPFDDPKYLFEIKLDGFRALAYVLQGECRLVSRNGSTFKGFQYLRAAIGDELTAKNAIMDGEIVSLNEQGVLDFNALLNRKGRLCYFAFDLLFLNYKDRRDLRLRERKELLRSIMPQKSEHLFYVEHVTGKGKQLFKTVRDNDMEGIVAKSADSRYAPGETTWFKIPNARYSQKEGRADLFNDFRAA
jgi:bifunctional non-homologous end joining protein LigD